MNADAYIGESDQQLLSEGRYLPYFLAFKLLKLQRVVYGSRFFYFFADEDLGLLAEKSYDWSLGYTIDNIRRLHGESRKGSPLYIITASTLMSCYSPASSYR